MARRPDWYWNLSEDQFQTQIAVDAIWSKIRRNLKNGKPWSKWVRENMIDEVVLRSPTADREHVAMMLNSRVERYRRTKA